MGLCSQGSLGDMATDIHPCSMRLWGSRRAQFRMKTFEVLLSTLSRGSVSFCIRYLPFDVFVWQWWRVGIVLQNARFVCYLNWLYLCAATFRRFFFPIKIIHFDRVFKQMTTIKTTTNNFDHKTYWQTKGLLHNTRPPRENPWHTAWENLRPFMY